MKVKDGRKYHHYCHHLDVDAFEEAIGFELIREGKNKHGEPEDIGHCPDPWNLHKNGDTTGKFAINREKRIYGCFVCGGGTLLDLTMAVKGWEEEQAEEWLYQFTKPIDRSDEDFMSEIEAILYAEQVAKPVMPYYNEHVLDKWVGDLAPIEGWLAERGISTEVALQARLGYQGDALRMAPLNSSKAREEPYSGSCVYFPHFWGGRLVGWQQRWLEDDRPKWLQKYTNTSGFPKVETVYNFESVYLADRPIIVCESVTTVLFLTSIGYPAVATFGGSVSDEQMRLLRRFQQGIVLAPDNDGPGRKWSSYTEEELQRRTKGKKVDRVILAEYLADYVPVRLMEPVGEYNSGNDLGDLLDGGPPFAAAAVKLLYDEAEFF